ncbi:MAG: hypothetical protein GY715_02155 [Planctomycetes bacterium]|nr:hypothetical protein [Planctomycetota bacterium]
MHRTRLLVPTIAVAVAAAVMTFAGPRADGQDEPAPSTAPAVDPPVVEAPPADTGPARVIVRESRRNEIMGHVELEDEDVIVVRALDGTMQRFAKRRVVQIIRLTRPAPGQRGVVVLRNGQTRDGIIVDDDFTHVTVEIEGVRTRLKREFVDHVRLEPSFDERYAHLKAMLRPDMPYRHLALCQWLVDQRRYALAEEELLTLLRDHPIAEGQELLTMVRAQIALTRTTKRGPDPVRNPDVTAPDPNRTRNTLPRPETVGGLLNREEVNLIRVFEIDFNYPPKVAVRKETIAHLIQEHSTDKEMESLGPDRTALYRAPPIDIVRLMFKLKARELYEDIDVITEPHALNLFRQRVHNTWLMNNCATSRCHGSPGAGRFFLHRRNYRDERVRYTNLLILERTKLDDTMPPLVNFEKPLESLIIQYGLPTTIARHPHPPVRGWSPAFRRLEDRMVRWGVEWMDAMLQPRLGYPVEYEPPVFAVEPAAPVGADPPERSSR